MFQARVAELELEAEELRQLWESSSRPDLLHMMPNHIFLSPEDDGEDNAAKPPAVLKRWDSERLLRGVRTTPGRIYDHECSCARRAEVMKYRGISLLNEVDAQYSALQAKYDELLQRCRRGQEGREQDAAGHQSIQITGGPAPSDPEEDHQPEYKKLFKQIFSHLQKSKKVLENRADGPPR